MYSKYEVIYLLSIQSIYMNLKTFFTQDNSVLFRKIKLSGYIGNTFFKKINLA